MFFALLACVTEETFPERFAEALCDFTECSGHDFDAAGSIDRATCESLYAADEATDYLVCHEDYPADLAADCIREAEADVDVEHGGACTGDWPSCWEMHCGVS